MTKRAKNNGANLGFEVQLWAAADKLRGNMEPSDYKHVALGLIFLKYISDAFEAKRADLLEEELADPEDPEEYLAENVFWVPKAARWPHLQVQAKQPTIGKDIDEAMLAIEAKNNLAQRRPTKGLRPSGTQQSNARRTDRPCERNTVCPKRPTDPAMSSGGLTSTFFGGFAGAEGKRGGRVLHTAFCSPGY